MGKKKGRKYAHYRWTILARLNESAKPLGPTEIRRLTGFSESAVKNWLRKLTKESKVRKVKRLVS